MSEIFLSYARSTSAAAQAVAGALRALGYGVWLDDELPAHRAFDEVIAERLQSAKAVVVIWSAEAAKSDWVRSEANQAREAHKLVQLSIDNAKLPMPFDRIQCADLKGWAGDLNSPGWRKVVASITDLTGSPSPVSTRQSFDAARTDSNERSVSTHPPRLMARKGARISIAVSVAILTLAALGAWLMRSSFTGPPMSATRVAVMPFETLSASPEVSYFANGLADQIATTLSNNHIQVVSSADAAALRGADRNKHIDQLGIAMILDGSVQQDGEAMLVRMHLDDPVRHAIIWSKSVEGSVQEAPQLQAQIATAIVGVLACSNRALRPEGGLSDPQLLGRYLRACDIFANQSDSTNKPEDTLEMLAALREVTVHAPDFAPAHSDLAKFDAYLAPRWPADEAANMRKESAVEAQRALALDPNSPDAYLAQAMLLRPTQWLERERLLRQGVSVDRSWPHTNGFLGLLLAQVGRMQEASLALHKAAAADLQINWQPASLWLEAGRGQSAPCISALSTMVKVNPAETIDWWWLLECRTYAHEWDDALTMLSTSGSPIAETPFADALASTFVAAKTRAPDDADKARRQTLAIAHINSFTQALSIQNLALLGFVDDAFDLAREYSPDHGADPIFLFIVGTDALRRDPRFMQLAARIGFVNYWQTTGHWPDFCSQPELPYDCHAEADRAAATERANSHG